MILFVCDVTPYQIYRNYKQKKTGSKQEQLRKKCHQMIISDSSHDPKIYCKELYTYTLIITNNNTQNIIISRIKCFTCLSVITPLW